MAEWRSRGYVADSDEEEDSQISLHTVDTSPQASRPKDDDTEFGGPLEPGNSSDSLSDESKASLLSSTGRAKPAREDVGEQEGATVASELVDCPKDAETLIRPGTRDGRTLLELSSQDHGDIDELQEGYYKDVSAAQLGAKLLQGAQKFAGPVPSTAPSPLQKLLPACSLPNSVATEVRMALHEDMLLTNENRSTQGDLVLGEDLRKRNISSPTSSTLPQIGPDMPAGANKATRTLRHRNPIQLHPYAIENNRYKQTLRARGMKALRLDDTEAEPPGGREEESQNSHNSEDSQEAGRTSSQDKSMSSSPLEPQDSPTILGNNGKDIFVFGDDEDLPDMNTLLRDPLHKYTEAGYKRRKIASPSFRMPPGITRAIGRTPTALATHQLNDDDDVMFEAPPSPPHSGSQTPLRADAQLPSSRAFRKSPQVVLPTPVTSSEPRRRRDLAISDDEFSDAHSNNRSRTLVISDASETDGTSSGSESPNQLQRVQRRIRGVLPASWLKLDLKTRQKKPREHQKPHTSISPERTFMQRGVARPVTVTRARSPDPSARCNGFLVPSNDEGSASDEGSPRQRLFGNPQIEHALDDDGTFFGERWGEAAENDRVDAMLPSAARSRHRQKQREGKGKYQMKIAEMDSCQGLRTHGNSEVAQRRNLRYSRMTERHRKYAKKRIYRPPKLGILDAPSPDTSSQHAVPRFIKVASRTARSRNDKGRHSPSRKYVRLATKQDDWEASQTLRSWRQGTIRPSTKYMTSTQPDRRPLTPRSGNNALVPRAPPQTKSLDSCKDPNSGSILPRPLHPCAKSRKSQSSLDHIVQRQATGTSAPGVLVRQHEQKTRKRNQLVSSIRINSDSRPAMLEASKENGDELHALAAFHRDLLTVNHFGDESGLPNVLRFFENDARKGHGDALARPQKSNTNPRKPVTHKSRKRRPHRMDVSTLRPSRSSTPIVVDDFPDTPTSHEIPERPGTNVVTGLGPFGTRYSETFDISPLPLGTCFHESSFIGSGSFARSLRLEGHRNLDSPRGHALLHIDKGYRWGPWNDTVSSELGELVSRIHQVIECLPGGHQSTTGIPDELAIPALQSIIGYFSDHLSFLDSVDRLSCVQRCLNLIASLPLEPRLHNIDGQAGATRGRKDPRVRGYIQFGTMKLVLANQIHQLSQHELVPVPLQQEARSVVQSTAQKIIGLATNEGIAEFEICIAECKRNDTAELIIRNHKTSIEALVVAQHALLQATGNTADLWKAFTTEVLVRTQEGVVDVGLVERSWKRMFTLLPFLELDAQGVLEIGRRFKIAFENWALVTRLISPVLEVSLSNSRGQSPSFNAYCRALFGRCLHLINGWGWRRCEIIIGTLFDFFARNSLAHLRNEASHGSPPFLEHLAENPSLDAQPEDRCFHILLKIIGSGIRHMRRFYTEKKVRDLVWRLMPNHGRSHPKEEAIRQEDLDALRNHHDLLCTLYWASPPSCRPRITVIRNLVRVESSHREACHINIRAWSNLVNYQLSTDEPVSCLQSFVEWHEDLLVQILRQHNLARTEAEDQVNSLQHTGDLGISDELLESTIAKNQRQVEATLSDALISLKLAVTAASNEEAAAALVTMTIAKVFEIFDASKPQAVRVVIQALDALLVFVNKRPTHQQPKPYEEKEDSQDYGEWPAFDEEYNAKATLPATIDSPLQHFQAPLRQLLSNCFGSDTVPDRDLLLKIVDVWVAVAQALVASGARSWHDYLDRFGSESWSSLRDTEQTRKYTANYLATLVEKEPRVLLNHRHCLLSSWISSLVERESLLKFQHRLTEALLNANCDSAIIKNLPFCTSAGTGRFKISAAEFSERRLSVISSVLSNMRVSLEEAVCDSFTDTAQVRQEYKDLLKHLMATMKHNYQELGNGSNTRGAYVDFVHRVVEFLQQHTSPICPIDRFFTDNGAFPLPANDPTYVVAQLKKYALRLHDPKTPKQVVVFLQSVSERAAVDGQQPYLVGQLHSAMTNSFEGGISTRLTLRSFLVKAVIPAYIKIACEAVGLQCGWILALPYLQALQRIFGELLYDLDGTNPDSVAAVSSIIIAFTGTVKRSLEILQWSDGTFQQPNILKLVSSCFSTITALLPVLNYIVRLSGPVNHVIKYVEYLKIFAVGLSAKLDNHDGGHTLEVEDTEEQPYADTFEFAKQQLRDTLAKNLKYDRQEKQYWFRNGGARRDIVVDIDLYEEEKAELYRVFEDFFECLGAMPALCDDNELDVAMRKSSVSGIGAFELLGGY